MNAGASLVRLDITLGDRQFQLTERPPDGYSTGVDRLISTDPRPPACHAVGRGFESRRCPDDMAAEQSGVKPLPLSRALSAAPPLFPIGPPASRRLTRAEVESSGDLHNGRQYRQQYHFLLELRIEVCLRRGPVKKVSLCPPSTLRPHPYVTKCLCSFDPDTAILTALEHIAAKRSDQYTGRSRRFLFCSVSQEKL